MRKQQRVALVCAGPVSRSGLARLPAIRDHLVWVKSSTPSAATRAANSLGGRAVRDFSDLASADVVLISAPDAAIEPIVEELRVSDVVWRNRVVVLIDSNFDSAALATLAETGAHAASLNQVDSLPDTLVLEGTVEARRRMRRLFTDGRHTIFELEPGHKSEYLAAVDGCTSAFLPTIAQTVDHFMRAGLKKAAAEKTATSLFESSLRAYLRAGKRLLRFRPPALPPA